jgi:hypothetical protein
MKITKGNITHYASQAKPYLQLGEIDIITTNGKLQAINSIDNPANTVIDAPDDWFVRLRDNVPVTGKQDGFLHLSKKGWDANKDDIKAAFEATNPKERRADCQTWQEYEKIINNEEFASIHKNTLRAQERTKKALAIYSAFLKVC